MSFYTRESDELRRRGRARAAYATFLTVRLDRRRLLTRAWAIARAGAARFGGTVALYIAEALRLAWGERREYLRALSREFA